MVQSIFISSSGDLATLRKQLLSDLKIWLDEYGLAHLLQPYLWEEEKEDGRLLSDRQGIQHQLPDPASTQVPLTICLFGERCGSPLQDQFDPDWSKRFDRWRAQDDGPGILHPWPTERAAQDEALARGQYPLTGTVFELLSAHAHPEEAGNLILGCCVDRPIMPETSAESVALNGRRLHARLTLGRPKEETRRIEADVYDPQASALLNLLKDHARKVRFVTNYQSEEDMRREIFHIATERIRARLGLASLGNFFKQGLDHWTLDDEKVLPGRADTIVSILKAMSSSSDLVMLKGRSGCGKSSLMQNGVMRRLREIDGSVQLPFRPTELMARAGDGDALDRLARLISECTNVPFPAGGPTAMRAENYARRLRSSLEHDHVQLVIGLDQFEEIIDELKIEHERGTGSSQNGWGLVMRFLASLCQSPNVRLIATLESAREKSFQELNLEALLALTPRTFNVDATDDTVAEIARVGFARGGLPLDPKVIEAIKRQWRDFERQTPGDSASPLPLACLFFHRLYERFADRAGITANERLENVFQQVGSGEDDHLLTLEEIGGENEIAFAHIIQKLADEAWKQGGGEPAFSDPIEKSAGFLTLNNFLKPLLAVDHDGQIQLRAVVEVDANESTLKLRRAFRERRLLVPVPGGGPLRIRPVHQALVDRWAPAKRWLELRRDYLQIVQRFREDATYWSRRRQPMPLESDGSTVRAAALTLHEHLLDWRLNRSNTLGPQDAAIRETALNVFDCATDPNALVDGTQTDLRHVMIAAQYHRVDLLRRFIESDQNCLKYEDQTGAGLVFGAAWSNGPAVAFLIEQGASLTLNGSVENAIGIAIWEKLDDNFDAMIGKIGLDDPVHGATEGRMIHLAAGSGNERAVRYLAKEGAVVDLPDVNGWTALAWAAQTNRAETFRFLLSYIDVRIPDNWGRNPISLAAANGSADVLSAYLLEETDAGTLANVLLTRTTKGDTPLMLAARYREVESLRALLQADLGDLGDPSAKTHRTSTGDTLLHLVLLGTTDEEQTEADRLRARAAIELLLQDGRLDPNGTNERGETPFDIGAAFPEAQRALRNDQRVPRNYAAMTPRMRIEDLSSRRPATVLRLLKNAPQALTDRHGPMPAGQNAKPKPTGRGQSLDVKAREGETGLEILIRLKNHAVLAILVDSDPHWPILHGEFEQVISLAVLPAATQLRRALLRRLAEGEIDRDQGNALFGICLDAEDMEVARALADHGAGLSFRRDIEGRTVLHHAAAKGDLDLFRNILSTFSLPLPYDQWGRRPSDLAAASQAEAFRVLESEMKETAGEGKSTPPWDASPPRPPFLCLEKDDVARAANEDEIAILHKDWNEEWGDLASLRVRIFDLPFYPDVQLAELRPTTPSAAGSLCFLLTDTQRHWLDTTSPPIHRVNGQSNLALDEKTVLEYLAFFCFFVRGDKGPFLVVDRLENSYLPGMGERAGEVADSFRPLRVWGRNEQGNWFVSGMVYYADALFVADFVVKPEGMIEMSEDWSLLQDLPGHVDAPLSIRKLQ